MADEKISHFCVVCGARLPQMSAYELKCKGAGMFMGDGSIITFCIQKHTAEQIAAAAAKPPAFHRASEERE
jgi:hypothetical protein